jgi:hypothetical protein
MSRKIVTIKKEAFEFLGWKEPYRSFYVRRGNGDLRVLELVGMLPPKPKGFDADYDLVKISRDLYATRFRCEFGDGTVTSLREYKFWPLSLSEISQLENVLQESAYAQKRKPAGKGGKRTSALSAKRAAAGRKHAKVTDPRDRTKIKVAFFRRTNGGISGLCGLLRGKAKFMCTPVGYNRRRENKLSATDSG